MANAFVFAIIAAFIHATWNFAVRGLRCDLSFLWASLLPIVVVLLLILTDFNFLSLSMPSSIFFLLSGVIHALYFELLTKAYKTGEVSIVYPLSRAIGICGIILLEMSLFGWLPSWEGIIGVFLTVLGIGTIIYAAKRSSTSSVDMQLACLLGLLVVSSGIVDKVAVNHIHPLTYLVGSFALALLILAPVIFTRFTFKEVIWGYTNHPIAAILLGGGIVCAYWLVLIAYQSSWVSYIVPIREFSIVISVMGGWLILKEKLTLPKLIATAFITLGLIILRFAMHD